MCVRVNRFGLTDVGGDSTLFLVLSLSPLMSRIFPASFPNKQYQLLFTQGSGESKEGETCCPSRQRREQTPFKNTEFKRPRFLKREMFLFHPKTPKHVQTVYCSDLILKYCMAKMPEKVNCFAYRFEGILVVFFQMLLQVEVCGVS